MDSPDIDADEAKEKEDLNEILENVAVVDHAGPSQTVANLGLDSVLGHNCRTPVILEVAFVALQCRFHNGFVELLHSSRHFWYFQNQFLNKDYSKCLH